MPPGRRGLHLALRCHLHYYFGRNFKPIAWGLSIYHCFRPNGISQMLASILTPRLNFQTRRHLTQAPPLDVPSNPPDLKLLKPSHLSPNPAGHCFLVRYRGIGGGGYMSGATEVLARCLSEFIAPMRCGGVRCFGSHRLSRGDAAQG